VITGRVGGEERVEHAAKTRPGGGSSSTAAGGQAGSAGDDERDELFQAQQDLPDRRSSQSTRAPR
jgi:hypothetical protein